MSKLFPESEVYVTIWSTNVTNFGRKFKTFESGFGRLKGAKFSHTIFVYRFFEIIMTWSINPGLMSNLILNFLTSHDLDEPYKSRCMVLRPLIIFAFIKKFISKVRLSNKKNMHAPKITQKWKFSNSVLQTNFGEHFRSDTAVSFGDKTLAAKNALDWHSQFSRKIQDLAETKYFFRLFRADFIIKNTI